MQRCVDSHPIGTKHGNVETHAQLPDRRRAERKRGPETCSNALFRVAKHKEDCGKGGSSCARVNMNDLCVHVMHLQKGRKYDIWSLSCGDVYVVEGFQRCAVVPFNSTRQ